LATNQLTLDEGKVAVPFLRDDQIVQGFGEEAKEANDGNADMSESDKINELLKMGFEESQCVQALKQAKGDLQLAASILGNTD